MIFIDEKYETSMMQTFIVVFLSIREIFILLSSLDELSYCTKIFPFDSLKV